MAFSPPEQSLTLGRMQGQPGCVRLVSLRLHLLKMNTAQGTSTDSLLRTGTRGQLCAEREDNSKLTTHSLTTNPKKSGGGQWSKVFPCMGDNGAVAKPGEKKVGPSP